MDLGTIQYNVEANTTDLDKANQSFDKMAENAEQAGIAVDGAAKKIDASTNTAKANAAQMDQTGNSYRNMRGMAQNLGFQLQDVAVQLQAGTSAAAVFSQQGSQLVSAWNPLAGAFIAVAGAAAGALLPSLFAAGESTDDLISRVAELRDGFDQLTAAQQAAVIAAEGLASREKNQEINAQKTIVSELNKEIENLRASHGRVVTVMGEYGAQYDEIIDNTGKIQKANEELIRQNTTLAQLQKDLAGIGEEGKLAEENAKKAKSIEDLINSLERQKNMLTLSDEQMASYIASTAGADGADKARIETLYMGIKAAQDKIDADKQAQKLADEAARKEEQRAQSIQKMTEQLSREAALMGNTSKEAEIRYGLSNGIIQAYGAEADALIRNALAVDIAKAKQQEYNDLISELDAAGWEDSFSMPKMEDADFNKLIEGVNNFGGAWSNSGSIIIDTFGSIADITDDYMLQLEELAKKEKNLQIARENTNGDPARIAEVAKAEKKLAQDRAKANISSYRSIAGAASEMFSEQSKGRKALHAVEMSLAAVELAMSAKKMVASAAAGAAKFFEQSGWAGFAGVSAMIATIGAIGGSLGGGGGSGPSAADIQESQGTGSVLGSNDKSESIANSFENFSDIAFDQLVELRGIRENLAKFEGGIAQLSLGISASGLAEQKYVNFADQNVGMIINQGLITRGSRSQDIAGRQMLAPLQGQISDIFEFINDSINSATGALEIAQTNPAWAFMTDIGKVSFQDMSAQEIEDELNAIFSQQADLITEFVVPAMKEYQQIGEGLFETLTRVAKEQAIFNDYMDNMGLSMAGVSSLMAIDMAQSIAAMMGGFENFTDKAGEYVDRFFTDEEKFGMLQRSLTETFGALGKELPTTTEAFRKLVEEAHKAGDQELFAALLEINPAVADYIDAMEEMKSVTEDMASAAADAANKIAQSAFNMMQSAINAEKKRIQDIVSGAGSAKSALDKAVATEKSTLKTAYDERISEIKALADAEKVAQDAINKARIDSLNNERDAVQDRIGALSGLFENLNRSIFDIALKSDELTRARRNAASFEIDTALSNARSGRGLPMDGQLSQALDILRDNPISLYATAEEMAFETAKLQNKLTELAGLTGEQLSRDEKSLLALDAQIASAEASSKFYETATTKYDEMIEQATKQYEADVAAQDAILAKAQEQYDALTGIDTKTLSVEAALIKYNESLLAADFENAQGQYERLDSILSTGQSQLNALLSIDDRILSVNDAVGKFIESINAAQSDQTNKEMLAQMQRMADEIAQLREEQKSQAFAQQKALNTTAKNTTELVYA